MNQVDQHDPSKCALALWQNTSVDKCIDRQSVPRSQPLPRYQPQRRILLHLFHWAVYTRAQPPGPTADFEKPLMMARSSSGQFLRLPKLCVRIHASSVPSDISSSSSSSPRKFTRGPKFWQQFSSARDTSLPVDGSTSTFLCDPTHLVFNFLSVHLVIRHSRNKREDLHGSALDLVSFSNLVIVNSLLPDDVAFPFLGQCMPVY